jgi:hypothetical protein
MTETSAPPTAAEQRPADDPAADATELDEDQATRIVRAAATPEWLLRISIESLLIVLSILLALFVDSWRQDAENEALATTSLEIFQREISQNAARIEDVMPYHIGLRDVVESMAAQPERVVEVRSIVEGLEPTFLLSAAWETALATGALRHIDMETVSALSLTYSLQQRYREESRAGLPRMLATPGTTVAERLEQMQQAVAYLNLIIRSELELHGVFEQALQQIEVGLGEREPDPPVPAPDSMP